MMRAVRSTMSPRNAMLRAVAASRALLAGCVLALMLLPGVARTREPAAAATPRSGDAWVDGVLGDISRYAARYPDAFADELVRYDSAPRALVDALLADPRWTPGDIYFACALGQVAGQRMLLSLRDDIEAAARHAQTVSDDDMCNWAPGLSLLSMQHEVQYSRLYRS